MQQLRNLAARAGLAVVVVMAVMLGSGIPGLVKQARAQGKTSYEIVAYEAQELASVKDLAAVLWAHLGTCDSIENAFSRRQCDSLRAARRAQLATRTFRMAGDRLSFSAQEFDDKKKALGLKLYACIACSAAVDVDGQAYYVLGTGQPTIFGTTVLGPVLATLARKFKDEAAARTWKSEVAQRLVTELVFRIPGVRDEFLWTRDLSQGVAVEVIGYRVHDPCTGAIIAAQPAAKPVARDTATCTGEDLLALQRAREEAQKPKDTGPKGPVLPERLTPTDIQEALKPAAEAAQKCYAIYGVAGDAKFRIKINGAGQVTSVEQEGYFVDTPTGDCIETAIRAATFPRTQKESTTVNYPFALR